jgi:hypothetical protein
MALVVWDPNSGQRGYPQWLRERGQRNYNAHPGTRGQANIAASRANGYSPRTGRRYRARFNLTGNLFRDALGLGGRPRVLSDVMVVSVLMYLFLCFCVHLLY